MLAASQILRTSVSVGFKVGFFWTLCFSALLWNLSERDIGFFDFFLFLAPLGIGFFTSVSVIWDFTQSWASQNSKKAKLILAPQHPAN